MFTLLLTRASHEADPAGGPEFRDPVIILVVLATFFVALRFTARWKQGVKFGADDWTIVVALLFSFAAGGLEISMVHFGLGTHAARVPSHDLTMVLKLLVAFECVYCTTIGIIKFITVASYILGTITVGWVIAINGVSIFQCRPIRKAWFPLIAGTCTNLKASFIGNAIPNILTDAAILCLPVREVWKLQLSRARRATLFVMFGLGFFVSFASIYRFTTLLQFQPADTTGTLATSGTWCMVEIATGIISTCLPTLRPLLKLVSNHFNDNRDSRSRSEKGVTSGSRTTELVTIGGTGEKYNKQDFDRLEDGMITVFSDHDVELDKRSDSDLSGRLPLTSITVTTDVSQRWSDKKYSFAL